MARLPRRCLRVPDDGPLPSLLLRNKTALMSRGATYEQQADEIIAALATHEHAVIIAPDAGQTRWLVHGNRGHVELWWLNQCVSRCMFLSRPIRARLIEALRFDAEVLPERIAAHDGAMAQLGVRPLPENERAALRACRLIEIPSSLRGEVAQKTDPSRYHELLADNQVTVCGEREVVARTYGPADGEERARVARALLEDIASCGRWACQARFYPVRRR